MKKKTILFSYLDWLKVHEMPAGKKKTLIAATQLFSQQGYSGTSTAQIAEKAGVSQANIFKYFKTKSDLLSEIMKPMIPELKKEFFQKFETYTNLEEAIHFTVQNRFYFLAQNVDFIKILIQEVLVNSEFRQEIMATFEEVAIEDYLQQIRQLYAQDPKLQFSDKTIRTLRSCAGIFFAYFVQRFILQIPSSSETEDLARIEQEILTLLKA